jgi:hypothetical protein
MANRHQPFLSRLFMPKSMAIGKACSTNKHPYRRLQMAKKTTYLAKMAAAVPK